MKIALVVAAGVLALSGCAVTSPPASIARQSARDDVDYARVAAINSAARSQGVMVQWINYPQSRKAAVGNAPALAEPAGG